MLVCCNVTWLGWLYVVLLNKRHCGERWVSLILLLLFYSKTFDKIQRNVLSFKLNINKKRDNCNIKTSDVCLERLTINDEVSHCSFTDLIIIYLMLVWKWSHMKPFQWSTISEKDIRSIKTKGSHTCTHRQRDIQWVWLNSSFKVLSVFQCFFCGTKRKRCLRKTL